MNRASAVVKGRILPSLWSRFKIRKSCQYASLFFNSRLVW